MRNLTFYVNIIVIKSTLQPMLTYLLQSISIPKEFLNELNKIFFKFLWSNKVEKIKRKMLIGPKIDSGLDMIDLNIFTKTIRVKWINLLNNETQAENNTTFFS